MQDLRVSDTFEYPTFVFPNLFHFGDDVLLEPIARLSAVKGKSIILSHHPELFIGHPVVEGVDVDYATSLPRNIKIIDLTKEISSVESTDNGKVILPEKNLRMWKAAGFQNVVDAPKLYLTPTEWAEVEQMKKWFVRPCIGIVLRSRNTAKDWAWTNLFIRALVKKKRFDVFIIGAGLSKRTLSSLPVGPHFMIDRPIRELMKGLGMMDVVIGPDTGPTHIAAALGRQTIVLCISLFADLYRMYPYISIFETGRFSMRKGIKGISMKTVLREVDRNLLFRMGHIPVAPKRISGDEQNVLFIRFRGLGDVLLSLPALATFKKLHPQTMLTYMTSPGIGRLVELSGVPDTVVEMKYNHQTEGLPIPPTAHDYSQYDTVVNAINAIDFGPESAAVPRPELFGELLQVPEVDYSTDWKFEIPKSWIEIAARQLDNLGIHPGSKIIVMQADSKGLSRMWPMVRQIEFIGLAKRRGYAVVIVSDVERKYPDSCVNLTGKLSFSDYVGMIGVSTILICPDSGGLHIAGASNNLALGLFGSVHPDLRIAHYDTVDYILGKAKCVPCNDWQHHCCKDQRKKWPMCMWSIKALDVMTKVEQVLKGAETNG